MSNSHEIVASVSHELHPPVEVLKHIDGLDVFLDGVIRRMLQSPGKLGKEAIVGESGIGKTTLSGQIILDKLLGNEKLQEVLKKMGKRFAPHYLSLAMCSKELKRRGVIKSAWGNLTAQEYALDSRFMEAAVDKAEQDFSDDPDAVNFLLIDTIAVDQLNRGTSAVKSQAQDENFSAVAVQTDLDVQDKATESREAIWETIDPKEFKELLEKFGLVIDQELTTEEDVEGFRFSSGTKISRDRINLEVNQEMWRLSVDLMKRGCPPFAFTELQDALKSQEDLESDPRFFDPVTKSLLDPQTVAEYRSKVRRLRTNVQKYYYEYLGEDWEIAPDHLFVTENTFIGDYPIHYYYALINACKLKLEEVPFTP